MFERIATIMGLNSPKTDTATKATTTHSGSTGLLVGVVVLGMAACSPITLGPTGGTTDTTGPGETEPMATEPGETDAPTSAPTDPGETTSETGGTTKATEPGETDAPTSAPTDPGETGGTTMLVGDCGDGEVDPGEECDLGPDNYDNGSCTYGCKNAVCGDGFPQLGVEECDFGAPFNDGKYGGCTENCTQADYCGDGVKNGPEECDDGGNDFLNDACLFYCVAAKCGDGYIQTGVEGCDDGSHCSDLTPCESNIDCQGIGDGKCEPRDTSECNKDGGGNCKPPTCGDDIVQDGEFCDDGAFGSDTCSSNCAPPCGDGIVQPGEECDDGLTCADGSACVNNTQCEGIGDDLCTHHDWDGCTNACSEYYDGYGVQPDEPEEEQEASLPIPCAQLGLTTQPVNHNEAEQMSRACTLELQQSRGDITLSPAVRSWTNAHLPLSHTEAR